MAINFQHTICENSEIVCNKKIEFDLHTSEFGCVGASLNSLTEFLIHFSIIILLIFLIYYVVKYFLKKKIILKEKDLILNKKIKKYLLIIKIILFGLFIIHYTTIGEECNPKKGSNCYIENNLILKKPIIYLYPETKQKIKVELDYKGKIIADYPEYNEKIKGWEVMAYADSRIIDLRDGKEYSYLFWEGIPNQKIDWDLNTGFIVEGKDAREFLREKLEYLGLTPKEYNEFIVYWYPKMMNNKYNLIHFATEKYTDSAPLKITPKPDSILRVFMIMKSVEKNTKIKEQKLKKWERKGFSVVEWGGSELR